MSIISQIEKQFERDDLPKFGSGDTIRVHYKIKEEDKERTQVFQGTVIGRRGSGTGATFTVRKISSGIGVERVFPACSPNIAKIEKVRSGVVRRAKLYYLRDLTGKSARIREKLTSSEANSNVNKVKETAVKPAKAEENDE
jgi:large subunit ribosomal protein L19